MKRVSVIVLVIFIMSFSVGCGGKDNVKLVTNNNEKDTYSELEVLEDEHIEVEDGIEENTENELEQISEEDTIAENSSVHIRNFLEDGTFWAEEQTEHGDYIIHADVNKKVLNRVSCDMYEGEMQCGINDHEIAIQSSDDKNESYISIMDVNLCEDTTEKYLGDNDFINDVLYENDIVFLKIKHIESFDEEYDCYRMEDLNGNVIFDISLEKDTLLKNYGIDRLKSWDSRDIYTEVLADNIYCVEYLGNFYADVPNALVVDLRRNSIIPISYNCESGSVSSDGNYTYVGWSRINNETGKLDEPEGEIISEDRFLIYDWNNAKYLIKDSDNNIVKELTNDKRRVHSVSVVDKGLAMIVFEGDYITLIDSEGEFLFEPVKGKYFPGWKNIYEETGLIVAEDVESGEAFTLDNNGNKCSLNISCSRHVFYVEYEGKKYWISDGEGVDAVCLE